MKKLVNFVWIFLIGSVFSLPLNAQALNSIQNNNNSDFSGFLWQDQYNDPLLMPKSIKATGGKVFVFSPRARQWAAYEGDGQLVGYGRANGGASFCAELNEACLTEGGKYRVFRKGDASCYSKTFPLDQGGGAPMPYCMFFNKGAAIHGSPQLSLMNSSHGCIRVTTPSASWLSNNFMEVGTRVLVTNY